jgi:hypothetical protein
MISKRDRFVNPAPTAGRDRLKYLLYALSETVGVFQDQVGTAVNTGADTLDDTVFIEKRRLLQSVIMYPVHDEVLLPDIGMTAVQAYPYKMIFRLFQAVPADINPVCGHDFEMKRSILGLADVTLR